MACTGNETSFANNTNCTVEETSIFSDRPEAFCVPVVFALIFIVGVVGNGTLILTVLKNKNMRNAPNIFIVSLAFGDLLLILVSVPFTATIYTFTEWPYGATLCKLNEFLQALSLGVSVFTLTVLSADRYVAIMDPMKRHRSSSTSETLAIAGVVWVVSTALAVLELVAAHIATPYGIPLCELHPASWPAWYPKFHAIFRFVVYFAVPIVTIGIFYSMMARILFLSSKIHGQEGKMANQQQRQMEARKKVAKVVLSFVCVFIVCWLPRHVYVMWYYFDPGLYNLFWHVFKIIGFCMSFINSCINPLALYFLSKQFRLYYNRYLLCCCHRKKTPKRKEEYSTMYQYTSTVRRTSTTMTMLPSQTNC